MAVTYIGGYQYQPDTQAVGRSVFNATVFLTSFGLFQGAVAGDLAIVAVGSSRPPISFNVGWNQIVNIGAGSSYVSAYWKVRTRVDSIFDVTTTLDDLVLTFPGVTTCMAAHAHLRSPAGFDVNSVKSNQQNFTTAAGASYALVAALGTAVAGELSVMLGGCHTFAALMNNTTGAGGAAWTLQSPGGQPGYATTGGASVATCPTVGTPAQPSVTFNVAGASMNKFIFAAVIREGLPPPPAGGGLFWG